MLEFNLTELSAKMERTALELHKFKGDDTINLLKLAISTARNIQMLEIHKVKAGPNFEKTFNYHLGRMEALGDLHTFIELALDDYHYDHLRGRKKEEVKTRTLQKNYGHVGPVI